MDGAHFYARYRGARVRIGFGASLAEAVDRAISRLDPTDPNAYEFRRWNVSRLDGYMTWDDMQVHFVSACERRRRRLDPRMVMATYVGPIPHLKGLRGIHTARDPYNRRWCAEKARVFVQFNDVQVQRRLGRGGFSGRAMHKYLGFGWHPFPPTHWRIDDAPEVHKEGSRAEAIANIEKVLMSRPPRSARIRG